MMIKHYQELNVTIEDYAHKNVLEILHQNMSNAMLFESEDIPFDIVKMYSFITLVGNAGRQSTFQIVPPNEVNIQKKKISVISSLGASVIGRAESDKITYGLPGDVISLKIQQVKQINNTNLKQPKIKNY
ncbi:GreA/GreB family elongation factor [Maribacter hydrothermalis]|nr:GreA/GreB family elongation factor [Maribacter hydrothermalis]